MPLYKFVTDILPATSPTASLLALALVVIQGFLLVRLNTRFIFITNRTYLPAIFFILLTASFPELQRLNPVIFSGFFLLLALEKIFESMRTQKIAYEYFIAALYISTGVLFYPFLAFFMVFLWISMSILKPFNWREWLFTIIGFALPIFFASSFYFLVYNQPWRLITDIEAVFKFHYTMPDYSPPVLIFLGSILFLILLSSQFILRTFPSKKIHQRKAFTIFFWLFSIALIVFLVVSKASVELIFLGAIPLSFLLAHYFALLESTFWGNIFIIFLLLLLLLIQTW
ncbi:MAG TPA: DUF6427 family protein [Bacteroidales bacterium]